MHDNYLYRMMSQGKTNKVDSMTYDELISYTYDNGANIDKYPNLKVTLLEDYLDECKKYNVTPVVEYKSKKNYEYLGEVVKIIENKGMENNCVIISFQIDALREFRKYDKNIPLWYLVKVIDDKNIDEAKSLGKNAGIDFDANREKNTEEMVKKVIDNGLDVGCWTVDDIKVVDKMMDWGVKTFTTNLITPNKTEV